MRVVCRSISALMTPYVYQYCHITPLRTIFFSKSRFLNALAGNESVVLKSRMSTAMTTLVSAPVVSMMLLLRQWEWEYDPNLGWTSPKNC